MQGHDRNDSSTNSRSSSELTTKKFRLPEELKQEIKDRAKSNYSGNASQLIRAAIHDHFSTLDGEGDRQAAHQTNEIENLQEQVKEIKEAIQEDNNTLEATVQQSSPPVGRTRNKSSITNSREESDEDGGLQNEIYSLLKSTDSDSLSITELTTRTDRSLSEAVASAEELVERGILQRQQDGETRSYLINTEQ
ncbi:ribbon-helix-helix domain-containing protein [Halorubrum ezzemoulense]|uniref:hypothetical protein n=1 Tax=Halorubrum ezzemoulense TaxID=337243 RepID=UPI00117A0C08|nr:hypothetical protein [Halorubrum ezzemoulense]